MFFEGKKRESFVFFPVQNVFFQQKFATFRKSKNLKKTITFPLSIYYFSTNPLEKNTFLLSIDYFSLVVTSRDFTPQKYSSFH